MSTALPLILLTGATGFVGAHVLEQALEIGYPVRIVARPAKVEALRQRYGPKVEVFGVGDVATGDYSEALDGVEAVIHMAAALPGTVDNEGMLTAAVEGCLNILRQSLKAGVKRVVITSSFAAVRDPNKPEQPISDYTYTDKNWNNSTREEALDGTRPPLFVYAASKALAEKAVWEFSEAHPEIDITTILPPFIFGPFAKGNKIAKGNLSGFSTNSMVLENILGGPDVKLPIVEQSPSPLKIDVRDVAKAHILALTSPLSSEPGVGRKRILLAGPKYTFADAVKYLSTARPELKDRLSDASQAAEQKIATLDTSRAAEVLGMKEFIDWHRSVEETVDDILSIFKSWETEV